MKDFLSFFCLPGWAIWLLWAGILLKSYEQIIFSAICIRGLKASQVWKLPLLRVVVPGGRKTLYRLSFGGLLMLIALFTLFCKNSQQLTTAGYWIMIVLILAAPCLVGFAIRTVMTVLFYIEQIPKLIMIAFVNYVYKKRL